MCLRSQLLIKIKAGFLYDWNSDANIRRQEPGKGDKAIYVFYVDVFLIQSCLMNVCILWMVKELTMATGSVVRWRQAARLLATSLIAGILQLGILLLTQSYAMYFGASFLVIIPGMIVGAFGRSTPRDWCRRLILGYVVALGLGGTVTAVQNLFHIPQIPVWIGILCALALRRAVLFAKRELQKREQLCVVVLEHNGQRIECTALWDTGNHLHTAEGNRPVHIVDAKLFKELKVSARDFAGIASYCSLGNSDGILPLYEIDALYTLEKHRDAKKTKAVVACAGKQLLEHKPYQVILNVEGVMV